MKKLINYICLVITLTFFLITTKNKNSLSSKIKDGVKKCTNATAHTKAALNYANTYSPGLGLYQVTGKSSVVFLG